MAFSGFIPGHVCGKLVRQVGNLSLERLALSCFDVMYSGARFTIRGWVLVVRWMALRSESVVGRLTDKRRLDGFGAVGRGEER